MRHSLQPLSAVIVFTVLAAATVAVSGCANAPAQIELPKVEIHPIEHGELELKQLKTEHQNEVRAVAFSPDGKWALTGDGGKGADDNCQLILWKLDGAGGMTLQAHQKTAHAGSVMAVAFSPDGKWALTGGADKDGRGSLILWKLDGDGGMTQQHREPGALTMAAAFSRDGRWALTGAFSGPQRDRNDSGVGKTGNETLILWRLDGKGGMKAEKAVTDGKLATVAVAISPDGTWALTSAMDGGDADGRLVLWKLDGKGGITQEEVLSNTMYYCLVFSPDGSWVLTNGSLWRIDRRGRLARGRTAQPEDFDAIGSGQVPGPVYGVAFSPDGQWALAGGPSWGHDDSSTLLMCKLDGAGGVKTHESAGAKVRDDIWAVAISPDGRWALTGGSDHERETGTLRLWELK